MSLFLRTACIVSLTAYLATVSAAPVVLETTSTNVVATWHEIAAATFNGKGTAAMTAEERRPLLQVDMTTVVLAMYDAASAIDGRYQPYAVKPREPAAGASMDAAVGAAAHGVLRGLFPSRWAHYQAAYDKFIAALPPGAARDKGLALGAEVAAGMLANRARDGRSAELPPYQPSKESGKYQAATAVMRFAPHIKPFTLTRIDQFRPGPPPALTSAAYAADFNETKSLGGRGSVLRTGAQSNNAQFNTEVPSTFLARNLGRFARSTSNPADAARLLAAVYVVNADAILACVEAKYFYNAWRPDTAIALAGTDGNPATEADPAWQASQFTPRHPEYPAGHSCTAGAVAGMLSQYFGTSQVGFWFDSDATRSTRTYANVDELVTESGEARIAGGMHFRFSIKAGEKIGHDVATWVLKQHFGLRK